MTTSLPGLGTTRLQKGLSLGWWVAVAAAWLILPMTDPAISTINLFVLVGIYAVIAYGVALLFGDGGLLSIAHGGLWGIGAYAAALLSVHFDWSLWMALPVGIVAAAVLAAVTGYPSLRVKGHYFVVVTFAFAELVRVVGNSWRSFTNGDTGLSIVKPGSKGDILFLQTRKDWYYAMGVAVALTVVITYLVKHSNFGRRLVAIRENEELAEATGVDTTKIKVLAFMLSGALAGASGVAWANYIKFVNPSQFGAEPGLIIVLMVLIGGARSIAGPLLGATFIVIVPDKLGLDPIQNNIVLGIVFIAAILLFPKGFAPVVHDTIVRVRDLVRRKRRGSHASAGSDAFPVSTDAVHVNGSTPSNLEPVALDAAQLVRAEESTVPAGDVILRLNKISKRFGGVQALDGVDVELRAREVLAIVGPNGSGKSTLFGIASGFIAADAGTVEWQQRSMRRLRPFRRTRLGLVRTFQETMVYPDLTVAENLRTALIGARRKPEPKAIAALADYVRLTHRLAVDAGSLSWGETRLLGIALALAQRPQLLMLDEPFAGLSPAAADDVSEILRRIIADGYSLGIIDHEMSYLLPLCDRVVVLDHGVKLFDGEPAAFLQDEGVASAYLGAASADL